MYRIRALDASDEELILAIHLKLHVGATPSDDEQKEQPRPLRGSAAILAMTDPPVASDDENNSDIVRGNDGMTKRSNRERLPNPVSEEENFHTSAPLPARKPGRPRKAVRLVVRPAVVRVITESSSKNSVAKTRGRPKVL